MPEDNDAGASTIRYYLIKLLSALWEQGEGFSAKRPFGGSGWVLDIGRALIKAGYVDGKLDDDGYVEEVNDEQVDELITSAILHMGNLR